MSLKFDAIIEDGFEEAISLPSKAIGICIPLTEDNNYSAVKVMVTLDVVINQ